MYQPSWSYCGVCWGFDLGLVSGCLDGIGRLGPFVSWKYTQEYWYIGIVFGTWDLEFMIQLIFFTTLQIINRFFCDPLPMFLISWINESMIYGSWQSQPDWKSLPDIIHTRISIVKKFIILPFTDKTRKSNRHRSHAKPVIPQQSKYGVNQACLNLSSCVRLDRGKRVSGGWSWGAEGYEGWRVCMNWPQ